MASMVDNLEESNINGIGSEADAAQRLAAAKTEEDWIGAGEKAGVQVWRVENSRYPDGTPNFGVNPWPLDHYGQFFAGDSFIVLHTKENKETGKLSWDCFFWIGKESSQDEYAVAAYKAVELDDLLGGYPTQHREVQEHESKSFLAAFDGHITYCIGGIDSGFRHAEPEAYEPRLFHVRKTGRHTKSHQVTCARASLNHGDAFVLDAGLKVYAWMGDDCSPFEKAKASKVAHNIANQRNKAERVEIDDSFWEYLGGQGDIAQDVQREQLQVLEQTLTRVFKLTDEDSVVRTTEVAPSRDSLSNDDAFCIDIGHTIYVWVGKDATKREGQQAMSYASQLIKDFDKPMHTRITRVMAGQEEQTGFWTGSGL